MTTIIETIQEYKNSLPEEIKNQIDTLVSFGVVDSIPDALAIIAEIYEEKIKNLQSLLKIISDAPFQC